MPQVGRRALSFTFMFTAVVLAMASAAYACTVFKGQIKVRGLDVAGHETHVATAVGNNSGMGWCSISGHANANGTNDSANDIYVEVGPFGGSTNCPASKLPATTSTLKYAVTIVDRGFYTDSGGNLFFNRDCMAVGGHSATKKIGDITIDSNGVGSGNYNIGAAEANQNANPYEAGVCVSDTKYNPSLYGNQVPLMIL